tara:strand:- start:3818 stop:4114 length:297 start_codon:yes stop_codon:yes gene_type:complete
MPTQQFPECLNIKKLIRELKISQVYNKDLDRSEFDIDFPPWLYKNYSIEEIENIVNFITKNIIDEIGGGDPIEPPTITIESVDNVPQNNTGGESMVEN